MPETIALPAANTAQSVQVLREAMLRHSAAGETIAFGAAVVEQADHNFVQLRSSAPAPVAALLERAGFLAAPGADDLDFWFHGERAQ